MKNPFNFIRDKFTNRTAKANTVNPAFTDNGTTTPIKNYHKDLPILHVLNPEDRRRTNLRQRNRRMNKVQRHSRRYNLLTA